MKSHSIVLVSQSFLLMFTLSACVSATQTPVATEVQPAATEGQPVATEVQPAEPQATKEAILRVTPDNMQQLLHHMIDYDAMKKAGIRQARTCSRA